MRLAFVKDKAISIQGTLKMWGFRKGINSLALKKRA